MTRAMTMTRAGRRAPGGRRRITGVERDRLGAELRAKYARGATIRDLMDDTGRSYGFVHQMLTEYGVVLRGRGGDHEARKDTAARMSTPARTVGTAAGTGGDESA